MRIPAIKGFDQQALEKYFKNTGALLIGRVGSQAIKVVMTIIMADYLLAYKNGVMNSGFAYVYFFAAIASLGLDQYIVKELHNAPLKRDEILGTAFSLKLLAGLCCIPLIWLVYQVYPVKGTPYNFIFILSFIGVLQSFNVIDSYFQSQVQSKYIMRVQIIGNLISAAFRLTLICMHAAFVLFIGAYTFDVLVLSAGYYLTYQSGERSVFNWRFNKAYVQRLLLQSWPLIISGIMVSIYMRIDQVMLQNIRGPKEAGAYATVAQLSEGWYFLAQAIVASLFPAILNARRDDIKRYEKRSQDLYDLMVYISLPIAIIISFSSHLIYKVYKPEYAYAAPVLSVHVWAGIFVFLGTASTQTLIAENYNRLTFVRTGVGAVVNIALNLILIPKMGMMGAAIATLAAYATAPIFTLFIPKVSKQGVMMLKSLFLISLIKKIRS